MRDVTRLTLSMETLDSREESMISNMAVKGDSTQQLVDVTQHVEKMEGEELSEKKAITDQVHHQIVPSDANIMPKEEKAISKDKGMDKKTALSSICVNGVRCMCGDPEQDLGMVQCDECKAWEHVVCAGYFSNSDKRLEALDKRSCLYCEHGQSSPAILAFLRELCRMRRALSVMYGEGFGNCQTMSRRLGNDPTHHPCRHLRCTIFSHLQASGR